MNQYTWLTGCCVTLFVILAYVGIVTEPKKKSAGWYTLLVVISLLIILSFIFMILHIREDNKKHKKEIDERMANVGKALALQKKE